MLKGKQLTFMTSKLKNDGDVGLLLIEKAYAKYKNGYFKYLTEPDKAESIIEHLTGVPPICYNTIEINPKDIENDKLSAQCVRSLLNSTARWLVPKRSTADSWGLPQDHFYVILEVFKEENGCVFRVKSALNSAVPSEILKSSSGHALKMKHNDSDIQDLGVFLLDFDEVIALFDKILVCPLEEGFNQFSFIRKGKEFSSSSARHELRYFEFEVPFKNKLNIMVTQYANFVPREIDERSKIQKNDVYLPIRIILAKVMRKNSSLSYEYVIGRGQLKTRTASIELNLDSGDYILCAHIEYPKDLEASLPKIGDGSVVWDIGAVLYTPLFLKLKPDPFTKINHFLNAVYASCAKNHGERTDLKNTNVAKNDTNKFGPNQLVFYEHFKREDGVFVQHFINDTDNIKWKYSANFTLTNMKIMGLPEHKQQIEIVVEPRRNITLLIMQTGGKSYEFLGGQGSLNLENQQKNAK